METTGTAESAWAAIEKLAKIQAENALEMKELKATMGRWANNHGFMAEEYFINSFRRGQRDFFGEKFDDILANAPGIKIKTEYDIALLNGKAVAIVEVKFRARGKDIPKEIEKADSFRINYPDFANHKIYLGLASMSFEPNVENECIENGIAIIKQVGDTMVINDKHLKAF
jgi:hypothetical protein